MDLFYTLNKIINERKPMKNKVKLSPKEQLYYLYDMLSTYEIQTGFKDKVGIYYDENKNHYHIWINGNPISNPLSFNETISFMQVLFKGIELGLNATIGV